jgi:transposase-like protein
MAKPYSKDLRRRVVGTIEGGATIPEAAEQCGVSISSVVRFLKLHRETGSVESAKFGGDIYTTWNAVPSAMRSVRTASEPARRRSTAETTVRHSSSTVRHSPGGTDPFPFHVCRSIAYCRARFAEPPGSSRWKD